MTGQERFRVSGARGITQKGLGKSKGKSSKDLGKGKTLYRFREN